jgi:diketogulonate reductase-like aldo/keto reductase
MKGVNVFKDLKVIGEDKVTAIGMGTWGIGGYETPDYSNDNESIEALRYGLELGINLIDTAEFYGAGHSEEIVGKAIKEYERESIFIISKVWPSHFRYKDVLKAAKNSVKRLNTYIDLYLLHWPNPDVPLSETMRAMEELVDEGLIRYIGVSNFNLSLLQEAQSVMKRYEVVANEVKYSLRDRWVEKELLPYMEKERIALIAYTPLEKGRLAKNKCLAEIGKKYNKTSAQVALNWLIWKENVIAIPKANNRKHLEENFGAMGWRLSKEDYEKCVRCV